MNKRILLATVALLLVTAAYGQPFELGVLAGTSLNGTSQVDFGMDIAYMYPLTTHLEIGAGAGIRYARPLYEISDLNKTRDGVSTHTVTKDYFNEMAVPFFARIRYSLPQRFYLQTDAGYRFALLEILEWFFTPEAKRMSGVYFEPQVGYMLDPKRSLAIGVSIQNSFYIKRDVNDDWDAGHFGARVRYHYIWRPVAFVRYCKSL